MKQLPDLLAVLNCLPAPAVLLSPDYRIVLANDAYKQSYGDGGQLQQRHCYEVSHRYDRPCDLAGESCPLRASVESRQPQRVLHLHHTTHGQEFVDVETFPIKNERGEVCCLIEMMRCHSHGGTIHKPQGIIGQSPAFARLMALTHRVAKSDTTVMLLGESGTGKEVVSRLIHEKSPRAAKAFVPVECTGLPETLFESELFGHEKGAFTGATHRKLGLVEAAEGGTLFLDEIGDITPAVQVKLLRLLETRHYRRIGTTELQKADFRLICATNKDLGAMVERGEFRQDLYYRLSVFDIHLPALRQRRDDIPPLAEHFLQQLPGGADKRLADESIALLRRYSFPGNVRELRNMIERALLLADGPWLLPQHFPERLREPVEMASPQGEASPLEREGGGPTVELVSLKEMERRYLKQAVTNFTGGRRELAQQLGISERALYRKLAAALEGS